MACEVTGAVISQQSSAQAERPLPVYPHSRRCNGAQSCESQSDRRVGTMQECKCRRRMNVKVCTLDPRAMQCLRRYGARGSPHPQTPSRSSSSRECSGADHIRAQSTFSVVAGRVQ